LRAANDLDSISPNLKLKESFQDMIVVEMNGHGGSVRGFTSRGSGYRQTTYLHLFLTMAAPPIKPKTTEVEAVPIHKIRITLTSRKVICGNFDTTYFLF
jgi:hypothetical protein